MPSTISYPSATFPAQPSVSLDLPDFWSGITVAATTLAAQRDVEQGEFMSNVIVRIHRVGPGYALSSAIAAIDEGLDSLSDLAEIGREEVAAGAVPGYRREVSYRDPQAGTLIQAVRVFLAANNAVVDLIEVIGTVGAARVADLEEVRTIQDSLRIEAAETVGP